MVIDSFNASKCVLMVALTLHVRKLYSGEIIIFIVI